MSWRGCCENTTQQQKPVCIGGASVGTLWQERNADIEKCKDRPWVKSVLTSWKSSICTLLAETVWNFLRQIKNGIPRWSSTPRAYVKRETSDVDRASVLPRSLQHYLQRLRNGNNYGLQSIHGQRKCAAGIQQSGTQP